MVIGTFHGEEDDTIGFKHGKNLGNLGKHWGEALRMVATSIGIEAAVRQERESSNTKKHTHKKIDLSLQSWQWSGRHKTRSTSRGRFSLLRFAIHLCPRRSADGYVPLQVPPHATGANVQGLEAPHLLPLLGAARTGVLKLEGEEKPYQFLLSLVMNHGSGSGTYPSDDVPMKNPPCFKGISHCPMIIAVSVNEHVMQRL